MIEKIKNNLWISAHLFYEEPFDKLLDGIQEFTKGHKSLLKKFFFIRYFENGPHLRLRILALSHDSKSQIEKDLSAFFSTVFRKYPSIRKQNNNLKNYAENNSIHFVSYNPETERYGGESYMHLAEDCFMISTNTYFLIKKEFKGSLSDFKIQIAVFLTISLLYCFQLDSSQIKRVNDKIFSYWSPVFYRANPNIKDARNHFEKELASTGENVTMVIRNLATCLSTGEQFSDRWLNYWIKENRKVAHKYYATLQKTELLANEKYVGILPSFIHMMNNRLGINNAEESYVAFIAIYALERFEE